SRYSAALLDGDRVDDPLDGTGRTRGAEGEERFPRLVLHHLLGVHVLEDVDAIDGQQDLMHLEHARVLLERDDLETPRVGADRHHPEGGEILRALHTQAWPTAVVSLV